MKRARWVSRALALVAAVVAGFLLTGCGGGEAATTVTAQTTQQSESEDGFAYREVERLSARTCSLIPRDVLFDSLAAGDNAVDSNNTIGLLYAKEVKIRPIQLQQAAYDGCIAGLEQAADRH